MTETWRTGRAALYGAIVGFIFTLIGLPFAPPDPQQSDPIAHQYFLLGQWIGPAVFFALLFLVIAVVRNFIARRFSTDGPRVHGKVFASLNEREFRISILPGHGQAEGAYRASQ